MEMVLSNKFNELQQYDLDTVNGGSDKWDISLQGFTINGVHVSWGGAICGTLVGGGVGSLIGGVPGLVVGGVTGCAVAALYDSF